MTALTLPASSGRFARAVAALAARPERTFAWFLMLHLAAWTVLPWAICNNLQLDLIEDLAMGREWQLGYFKHPPLPWWLADIAYRLSGGEERIVYLLAQLTIVAAFWAVWRMAREVVGPLEALISVAVLEGIHYYTISSIKFAHDQGQLPFWALTVWFLYRALARGRPLDWALAGLGLALAFWSKYAAAMLAAPLFLFLVLDPQARRCWRTAGPWIAAAVFAAAIAPHAIWLVQHDFLPLSYVEGRSARAANWLDHVRFPASFLLAQLGFLVPAIALVALLVGRPGAAAAAPTPAVDGFAKRYVTVAALGPCALTVLAAAIDGRALVVMWGYPFWLFLGLAAMVWLRPAIDAAGLRRFAAGFAIVFIASTTAYAASELVEPLWNHRMKATHFPGRPLATEVTRQWRAVTDRPLAYAAGAMFLAGNVAVYAPDHPRLFSEADRVRSPWVEPDALRRAGAVILWYADQDGDALPAALRAVFPDAEARPPLELPWQSLAHGPPARIGFAIQRPQP